MTRGIIVIVSLLALLSAFQPKPKAKAKKAKTKDTVAILKKDCKIKFNDTFINCGIIKEGEDAYVNFSFINQGRGPITIEKVETYSENWAPPYYPTDSIPPGNTGTIKTATNTSGRLGINNKRITVITSCGRQDLWIRYEVIKNNNGILWSKTEHDFGTLQQGQVIETWFKCYNGADTLIIENVQASCGCIVPGWQKTPVLPYKSTIIKAEFDTQGKSGKHTKVITVYTNRGLYELIIRANILKP